MRIGDLAQRAGVSVRSLRHYEKLGLVAPVRSDSGQRVYQAQDVAKLRHVLDLKRLGLPLADIKRLMAGKALSIKQMLELHSEELKRRKKQIDEALALTDAVLTALDHHPVPPLSDLSDLIKLGEDRMTEAQWQKVYDKYYSPEEQERWREAKSAIPEDQQRHAEQAWPELIARIEAMLDKDPASPEAQQAVKEWNALLQPLWDHDPALMQGAAKLWQNMDDWPEGAPEPPFSPAVWDFIQKAMKTAEA